MAGRIMVNPEQIEEMARQFLQGGEQSRQIIAGLTQMVNSLEQEWEGLSKQRFFHEFQEADKQMQAFVSMLESIGEELAAMSNKFRALDQTRF
ncbi:type VII secretion protein EsxA [Paenibacillus yonginensis]|uniref:ESAT-6-like protein n=1 Tax=Paenibacillus yonginensis TaxID=1462996 RepID=A0A1B1MY60_9BACL|nr:WXG100 family type VII secretion target [Paenibacillus yonginensis]ANS74111.1 type VII secretion protein EsxA [Paenibacillus yonginensis]